MKSTTQDTGSDFVPNLNLPPFPPVPSTAPVPLNEPPLTNKPATKGTKQ